MIKKFEISALLLRLTLGIIFLVHGLDKLKLGIQEFSSFVDLPFILGITVTLIELIGGIALLIGIKIRLFCFMLIFLMVSAVIKVKLAEGFFGGYEYNFALLGMLFALLISGSRLFSYDEPKRDKYI